VRHFSELGAVVARDVRVMRQRVMRQRVMRQRVMRQRVMRQRVMRRTNRQLAFAG